MRLENIARNVEQSGTMQVAKATIKATPKIFNFFADQTYADKPVAICRELVANGIDAHTAAGKSDVPVEVHLPTSLDPVFKVKDFGTGMPHDFVMGPFMAYTDGSTKDQSDEQIGGFGIGSKSPFAYCDQFTLRVTHDGVLSVYTMFKDTDGVPSIGLQGQKTTDEANGVEVSFPVEDSDIASFRVAAQKALQHFKPLPVVLNGEVKAPEYSHEGAGWALRQTGSGELGVIMGGVRYPVVKDSLEYELRHNSKLMPLLDYGIDLTLPIGACGIALSREALSYDKRTSESIKNGLENILGDVVATFANMFDDAPTLWQAMIRLDKEVPNSTWNRTARQQLIASHAFYKGRKIDRSIDLRNVANVGGFRMWTISPKKSWGRQQSLKVAKWKTPKEAGYISPTTLETLIIDDLPQSPKSKFIARIEAFAEAAPRAKDINIIRLWDQDNTDKAVLNKLLDELGNPPVIYTSALPIPVHAVAQAKAKNIRPNVRMFTFTGEAERWTGNRPANLTPGGSKHASVKEIKYADQPDDGIMVVMTSFDLPQDFYKQMDTGLINFDELHFVNVGDWPKLKDKWTKFEDEFAKRLAKALKKAKNLEAKFALDESKLSGYFKFIGNAGIKSKKLSATQLATPFGQIITLKETYIDVFSSEERRLEKYVTPALPTGVDPEALIADFRLKQADAALLRNIIRPETIEHVDLFIRNL